MFPQKINPYTVLVLYGTYNYGEKPTATLGSLINYTIGLILFYQQVITCTHFLVKKNQYTRHNLTMGYNLPYTPIYFPLIVQLISLPYVNHSEEPTEVPTGETNIIKFAGPSEIPSNNPSSITYF